MQTFRARFSDDEKRSVAECRPATGKLHPLHDPLLGVKPSAFAHRLDQTLRAGSASSEFQKLWDSLKPRMMDLADTRNAAAALAELRVYGDFREAGFDVTPVPRKSNKTPDFHIVLRASEDGSANQTIELEVAAKQETPEDAALARAFRDDTNHPDIETHSSERGKQRITFRSAVRTPAGAPDPEKIKPGMPRTESVTTNMISKVCSVKQKEEQLSGSVPAILWIDLFDFSDWPVSFCAEDARPLLSTTHGLQSGYLWNAFYGQKNDPIWEGQSTQFEPPFVLGHNGRFSPGTQSKLSAACIALGHSVVVIENPYAPHPLPPLTKRHLERLPHMALPECMIDLPAGNLIAQLDCDRSRVASYSSFHAAMMGW